MVDLAGNTLSTALNIGTLNGDRLLSEAVSSRDRNDYYRFSISAVSNFSLSLTGLRNNADVQLLDGQGRRIRSSTRSGRSSEAISRQLQTGDYYIRVAQRSGDTNYDLRLSSAIVPVAPPVDPGPTFATAFGVDLANGPKLYRQAVGTADPTDIYRFTLNSPSNLGVTLSGLTGRVGLSLYFDANGDGRADSNERILSESNPSATFIAINQILGAGTYYVEVAAATNSNTAYNLNLATTAIGGIQPTVDPGARLSTAFDVGVLSGNRAYRQFVGIVDPIDTYRFTLNGPSTAEATLTGLTGRVELSLYFDANNNGVADTNERITSGSNPSAGFVSINQTLGAGTYFVEVAAANSNTTYNLNLTANATSTQPTVDPGTTLSTAFDVGALSGNRAYRQFVGIVDPIDTYRFTVSGPSTVGATLSGLTGQVGLSLYFDANNNGIAESEERITSGSNLSATSVSINQTLGAGTYFVEVAQSSSTSNTAYNLNLAATPIIGIQPTADPGETFAAAFNVGALNGSRSYRQFVGVVDPIDTYRFSLISTTNFGVALSGLTGRVLLSLFFDANNNGVIESTNERLTVESNFNRLVAK